MGRVIQSAMTAIGLVVLCFGSLHAECWGKARIGDRSSELHCLAEDWQKKQDLRSLRSFVDALFYVYVTDGNHPIVQSWMEGMRAKAPRYVDAIRLRHDLIRKYTFLDFQVPESAALWAMVPPDARALFVLTLEDASDVPKDILGAAHLAVYDELERYFLLVAAPDMEPGVLPEREYERLREVLRQMEAQSDAFLFAVNQYYQGVVCMNQGGFMTGQELVETSRTVLQSLIADATDKLARKRILRQMALANLVLGNDHEARMEYLALLKIDPQDWNAILNLSYILNESGDCSESSVWVEATRASTQELFDITIHCGSRALPEEKYPTEPPAIAAAFNLPGCSLGSWI